ncbi:FAD-binding domain-containing protein [Rhizopogon salebrosus TDB-379]|nr:FAD-binding domain-containing protein [Rhizopogon salebrosus TDB-379]
MKTVVWLYWLPLLISTSGTTALQAPYNTPTFVSLSSNNWPSDSKWRSLNASLGGRLEVLRPWAAVCYSSDPLFDYEECQAVLTGYDNDTMASQTLISNHENLRENVSSALLWTNWEACGYGNGCALNYSNPQVVYDQACLQGTTPPYSIAINNASDASIIVKWATNNKVKLTVKNTGHDYLGRSAAPSTLQVNTHAMKDISYVPSFVPQGSSAAPVPALSLGAGAQLVEIYAYAEVMNISVVLGACTTVGAAGGYLQGGGHGVLTPAYGLGADQVLEIQLVTADGSIKTINAVQDPELFWAVRGGGAGSWGIITSMTIQTYPVTGIGASFLVVAPNPSQNSTTLGIDFISLLGKYQNKLVESGIVSVLVPFQTEYILNFYWPTTTSQISTLYPFFSELLALSSNYSIVSNTTSTFPSVTAAEVGNIGPFFDNLNLYGASNQLSSRLVPHTSLTTSASIQTVAEAIWAGAQILNAPLQSGVPGTLGAVPPFLLGNMPYATRQKANETGANPGLYEASWHIVFATPWTVGASKTTSNAIMEAVHSATNPLTALGITSSYQNEGDAFEMNWQQAFFGYKYANLSSIKQKYDPQNFFTTYKGVASVTNLAAYQCYDNDLSADE